MTTWWQTCQTLRATSAGQSLPFEDDAVFSSGGNVKAGDRRQALPLGRLSPRWKKLGTETPASFNWVGLWEQSQQSVPYANGRDQLTER